MFGVLWLVGEKGMNIHVDSVSLEWWIS